MPAAVKKCPTAERLREHYSRTAAPLEDSEVAALALLLAHGPLTIARLARLSGYAAGTTQHAVSSLTDRGLADPTRERPPRYRVVLPHWLLARGDLCSA